MKTEKMKMIEQLSAISKAVSDLPSELLPSNITIDGFTEMGNAPALSVWESSDTKPSNFYDYADRCGKQVHRTSFTENSDALWFLVNGVCLLLLTEKEDEHDEGTEKTEKEAE